VVVEFGKSYLQKRGASVAINTQLDHRYRDFSHIINTTSFPTTDFCMLEWVGVASFLAGLLLNVIWD